MKGETASLTLWSHYLNKISVKHFMSKIAFLELIS